MKRIVSILAFLMLFIASILCLSSCSQEETLTLNVYNWGEYISDGSLDSYDTNAEFEAYCKEELGINVKVNYSTYATNEDMYSKITSEAGTYDIIIPSDYMIQRLAEEGWLYEFDVSELENYENVPEEFRDGSYSYYDPENKYSVPYAYGIVGIIYNTTMVDEADAAEESWGLLFNEKYAGKILQFNNPRDAIATSMYYQGLDVNSTDKADWDRGIELLKKQKPIVQSYVNDEIFNKMISNSASIAAYYAGDYITMSDANPNLAFFYPKEGTNVFTDAMCIPKNAKNPELAKEYMNFMLSEEAAVANALYIGYASPNKLVVENEEYIDEMGEEAIEILYGTEVNQNYGYNPSYKSFSPEMQEYTNSLWEGLKTQNATELWVHIASIAIVGAVISLASYSIYIKKKRSRDYRYRDKKAKK